MRFVEAAGVRMSAIGLGTWQFGSREWGYGKEYADHEAAAIVRRALELGVNVIDTAEVYALGRSETIVAAAIEDVGRDEVFLATKVFPLFAFGAVMAARARASLRRLGVDAADLYQIHFPNPAIPFGLQAAGLARVLDDGLAHHVGVSNYSLAGWRKVEDVLGRPVLSNQVQFSMVRRRPAEVMVPYAASSDRVVIAYSPLAQGFLSARYGPDNLPGGGVRRSNSLFSKDNLTRAADLYDALRDVASSHDAEPAQVALAWLIHHPHVVAIPGASSVEQVEFNAAAADIVLGDDEFAHLTKVAEEFTPASRGPLGRLVRT